MKLTKEEAELIVLALEQFADNCESGYLDRVDKLIMKMGKEYEL